MADHFGNRYFPGRYFPAGYFQDGGEQNPGAMSASLSGSSTLAAQIEAIGSISAAISGLSTLAADLEAFIVIADNSAGAGYSGVSDGRILRLKQVQDENAERKRRAILASNAAIMSAVIASIVTFEGLNG